MVNEETTLGPLRPAVLRQEDPTDPTDQTTIWDTTTEPQTDTTAPTDNVGDSTVTTIKPSSHTNTLTANEDGTDTLTTEYDSATTESATVLPMTTPNHKAETRTSGHQLNQEKDVKTSIGHQLNQEKDDKTNVHELNQERDVTEAGNFPFNTRRNPPPPTPFQVRPNRRVVNQRLPSRQGFPHHINLHPQDPFIQQILSQQNAGFPHARERFQSNNHNLRASDQRHSFRQPPPQRFTPPVPQLVRTPVSHQFKPTDQFKRPIEQFKPPTDQLNPTDQFEQSDQQFNPTDQFEQSDQQFEHTDQFITPVDQQFEHTDQFIPPSDQQFEHTDQFIPPVDQQFEHKDQFEQSDQQFEHTDQFIPPVDQQFKTSDQQLKPTQLTPPQTSHSNNQPIIPSDLTSQRQNEQVFRIPSDLLHPLTRDEQNQVNTPPIGHEMGDASTDTHQGVEEILTSLAEGDPALPPPHPICFSPGLVPDEHRCWAFHECEIEGGVWQVYSWKCIPGHVFDPFNLACVPGRCRRRG